MNILIIKLSALGDVVQAIPTFEALRRNYPTAHIAWLVEEESAGLLLNYPGLDEVITCRRRSWLEQLRTPASWLNTAMEMGGLLRRLRRRRYDLVIDLQGLLKSAVWVVLARGTRKIGFDRTREGSWWFLNERLPAYDPDRHALERYLDMARYLGAQVDEVRFQVPWTPVEEQQFEQRLHQVIRRAKGPLVALHPMGRWSTKLWPEDHFASLASEVVARLKATVVFTGSGKDRNAVSRIIGRAGCDQLFNWAGTTSLAELAYLYKQASVVVSTDSGPMHLAAAMGTSVVGLFGPTAPWRTGPFGRKHKILRVSLDCSPCFRKTCETMICMKLLGVDEVLQAVTDLLGKE
jgi:heptosyltransferase-1